MGLDVSLVVNHPAFQVPFTVRRPTLGMQEGVATHAHQDIPFVGVVQPAKPADLMGLPEGQRLSEVKVVWSTAELKAAPGEPDIIVVAGRSFRVVKLEARTGYWKALAEFFEP